MKLRTSLRAALGVAVSAATLLALVPLGVAQADEADVADSSHVTLPANGGNSATLTLKADSANYFKGHTFKALRLGEYVQASKDKQGKLTGVAIDTVDDSAIKDAATTAYEAGNKTLEGRYAGNPIGKVAAELLGYSVTDTDGATVNQDSTSAHLSDDYAGQLRDFAQRLGGAHGSLNAKFAASGVATATGTDTGTEVQFTGLPQGLYMIKDVTAKDNIANGSQQSIPMIVGTEVGDPALTEFADSSTGSVLGQVNVKSDYLTIHKWLDNETPGQDDWVPFHIASQVPLVTGSATYKYQFEDTSTFGFTLPQASDTEHYFKAIIKTKDANNRVVSKTVDPSLYTVTAKSNADEKRHNIVTIDFKNSLVDHKDEFPRGATIQIDYFMQFNGNETNAKNEAKLVHSVNDGGSDTGKVTPEQPTEIHDYSFSLSNLLRSQDTPLTGSTFSITPEATEAVPSPTAIQFVQTAKGEYHKATTNDTTHTTNMTVSDAAGTKGSLKIGGLLAGTYTVKQTAPAKGLRNVMLPTFKVKLAPSATDSDGHSTSDVAVVTVANQDAWHLVNKAVSQDGVVTVTNAASVAQLPLTGGAGVVLAALAVILLGLLAVGSRVLARRHEASRRRA